MVAVVAGAGLGVERTSAFVLGSLGQLGSAGLGRAGDNVYVNAATGNLIVENTDEMLIGLGQDDVISRTYNSLGAFTDDNGDNWRESVQRQITGLTGTVNTAGSTVTRMDWDGSNITYAWDTARNAYVSKEGAGAYDTLTFAGSTWTWTDGSSQVVETYDANNGGRLIARTDTDGNALTFTYGANGLVSQVTTANGEYTSLVYDTVNTTQLKEVDTWRHTTTDGTGALVQLTRVRYGYDAYNRLTSVTVDLSPADNSISDGKTYVTTYTYDDSAGAGSSKRIASIAQTDGSLLQVGYTLVGSDYRVSSLTQTVSSGVTRLTTFAYNTSTRTTTITGPDSQVTTLTYDASGQLTQILAPAAVSGAAQQLTQFAYNANGDVTSVTPASGKTVSYAYDANGNQTLVLDQAGDTIQRTFGAKNELLSETYFLTPDPDGAGSGQPSSPVTTNYVYDAEDHLRYVISATGDVTEYRYNAVGEQVSVIEYASNVYNGSMAPPAPVASGSSQTVTANSTSDAIALYLSGGVADTVAITSGPSHGTLSVSGASVTYTPTAGYTGADSFSIANLAAVTTSSDGVFGDNTAAQIAAMTPTMTGSIAAGYAATVTVGVAR
ncbi:MAG TPA: hypothetical protein VF459_06630 [Caulobacteraceae bacterium]